MGGIVATEGRHRGNDGAELGLRIAGRRVRGDLLAQALVDKARAIRLGLGSSIYNHGRTPYLKWAYFIFEEYHARFSRIVALHFREEYH